MSEHEWKASVRNEAARARGYPIAVHGPTGEYGISMRSAWGLYESLRDALAAAGARPPAPRTAIVRIAVAVDEAGHYQVAGYRDAKVPTDATLHEDALDYLGVSGVQAGTARVAYVTASVPLPEAVEVRGEVEA